GINGIGTFRELAAQGIDVLIIDQGDFCNGASAASSHMLHGGLRYLENAEFRLVREALYERNLMLKNAPHYAIPAPTTIPIFRWFSGMLNAPLKFLRLLDRPGERGIVVIKIGLVFYDWFARRQRVMPTHQVFQRKKTLDRFPKFNPEIIGSATYYDAWMPSPERISIDLLLDAEAMHAGARAINYMSLDSASGDTVVLCDEKSGQKIEVKPRIVINAAGPWIDFANDAMQRKTQFIGGTKGSHLVVDHPELHEATQGNEIFFENEDGRIVLIFPLEDRVMMGSTDIPVNNPDEAVCTEEEVDYILGMVKKVFPSIEINHSHIVFKFCGVRPLPASDAATAGQISRDHSIRILEPGSGVNFPIYSLVGGKWTTFRAFSEQTADKVLAFLGKARKVDTHHIAIGGGRDYPSSEKARQKWIADLAQETKLPPERVKILFERYGTRAADAARFICAARGDRLLTHRADYSTREVMYIVQHEQVIHLDDFALR
ncbi:MAG TPA: glycerol-3-phosphate dehydrogenase/oxidase, partial [Aggregatilineales bacterium]|nr:glycerol-3-phosphate dehydrogenase/oxidase [Aggregatilineales bacterium]